MNINMILKNFLMGEILKLRLYSRFSPNQVDRMPPLPRFSMIPGQWGILLTTSSHQCKYTRFVFSVWAEIRVDKSTVQQIVRSHHIK